MTVFLFMSLIKGTINCLHCSSIYSLVLPILVNSLLSKKHSKTFFPNTWYVGKGMDFGSDESKPQFPSQARALKLLTSLSLSLCHPLNLGQVRIAWDNAHENPSTQQEFKTTPLLLPFSVLASWHLHTALTVRYMSTHVTWTTSSSYLQPYRSVLLLLNFMT